MFQDQNMGLPSRIPSLAEALHDVDFPISREDLLAQYGDAQIEFTEGRVQTLDAALAGVEQPLFKSVSDVTMTIGELQKH